jgi:hypothetical protein
MNPYRIIDRARPKVPATKKITVLVGEWEVSQLDEISSHNRIPLDDLVRQVIVAFCQEYVSEVKPKADRGGIES